MKKKTLIIFSVILVLALIIIYLVTKNKENPNDINKVSDIDTSASSENIKDVDFSKLEKFNIKLTETLKITSGGVYTLTGAMDDGQIYIDTKESVKLILNNVDITNKSGPAIMVENAKIVYIELADDSVNYLTDGEHYNIDNNGEPNSTIFSKDDLVLAGSGKLVVNANYEDGITSKDNLKIIDGTYEIESEDDAIRGKDSLVIINGSFTINSSGDGLKSTNDTDTNLGYILIENGKFDIVANNDGIQSETDLVINGGTFNIKTGGGSSNSSTTNDNWGTWGKTFGNQNLKTTTNIESAKGLKAGRNIVITNGEFIIDSSDDSIHSNDYVGISSGNFTLNSGDDGVHADNELVIDDGNIDIQKSYEGIEAESITINGGNISVIASDDGMNASGGSDGSSMNGRPGMNNFVGNGNSKIQINGGNIFVDATGDGIDSNGSIYITGGITIVNGPTSSADAAIDYDGNCIISGGILVASGSSGMAEGASSSSTQNSAMINFSKTISSSTLISIYDSAGTEILTYKASKNYQNLVISTPSLKLNETYTVFTGGNSTNDEDNGLYSVGGYKDGNEYITFTLSNVITIVGKGGGMTQGGMNQGGKNQGMGPNMKGPMNYR